MNFTSGKRTVRNISIEQLKLKIGKIARPKILSENEIDAYVVDLRIKIRVKGEGFYTEIPTTITFKNTKRGIEIITTSNLFKPLMLSIGLALTTSVLYYIVFSNWKVIFPFSFIFMITFVRFIYSTKKRAEELLKEIK